MLLVSGLSRVSTWVSGLVGNRVGPVGVGSVVTPISRQPVLEEINNLGRSLKVQNHFL